jgi:hypothetical protein
MSRKGLRREWRKRIQEWKSSGVSAAQWCRDNNITACQFYYWRAQFEPQPKSAQDAVPSGEFIELKLESESDSGVVIELDGVQLRVSSSFDERTLLRCLQILRSC